MPACFRRSCALALLLVALPLSWPSVAGASPEAEYEKLFRKLKPADVVSAAQYQQARRADPLGPLQVSGIIQGVMESDESCVVVLSLIDKSTLEIRSRGERPEVKTGSRVRCLVEPADASPFARLDLLDIAWDKTPIDVLVQAARAALKIPVKDKEDIARSAAELSRRAQTTTSRRGDPSVVIKRAIAHLNPRLTSREIDVITSSILTYCSKYGVADPYLVVAVIAAESRFNPNARSYKGAAGLGQLMPATAAAHGVNPYDPVANLEVAIRILRRNLDKYGYTQDGVLKALAAYNAGTGAVRKYGGVPPYRETRNYLWTIYEYWCWLRGVEPVARPK